jgi:hypothetical protein
MDKQLHTSQRRGAPLLYNNTGSNGTANANVTAERSSALIHHHELNRKSKCNDQSGEELRWDMHSHIVTRMQHKHSGD